VYNFFFGITFTYSGLTIKPCIPKAFGSCSVNFTYLGKKFFVDFKQTDDSKDKKVIFNGKPWETQINVVSGRTMACFCDEDLTDENIITMEY